MSVKRLSELERELSESYTENLTINTTDDNPHLKETLSVVGNSAVSRVLWAQLRAG